MAKKLKILNKLKKENIKYFEYKKRFLIVVIGLFLLIVLAIHLLQIAYASYESQAKLIADINIKTTTNLPLTIELYRNENYDDVGATNLFANAKTTQDEDGAWYNYLEGTEKYQFLYSEDETDIYTLVVYFPENYKDATDYADNIENIEVDRKYRSRNTIKTNNRLKEVKLWII